jgi:hypothetical protein
MQTMDGGKREVFDIRALTVPPLCRYVLMVAWSGVEVNYSRGYTAWGLACPFVAASRGRAMNCPAGTKNAINRIRPESAATELSVWPVPPERGPTNDAREGDGKTLGVSENP